MRCSINRNSKGQITEVLNSQDQPSVVFQQLSSNPFVPSQEVAANIAINILDKFEDEPLVFEDMAGNTYESTNSLLFNGVRGQVDVKTKKGERVFSFSTEKGTANIISDAIQQGIIEDRKTFDEDGNIMFEGKGQTELTKRQNAQHFVNLLKFESFYPRAHTKGQNVITGKHLELISVENEQGEIELVPLQEVRDNPQNFKDSVTLLGMLNRMYEDNQATTSPVKNTLQSARENMLGILSKLGISTTTIKDYFERYKNVHGTEPNVMSVADLANQVIAFAQGQDTIENLTEETVHVLLEAYNEQASLMEALIEVAETPEYAEFAEMYRGLYGKTLQGTALEDKVRKEILGKIIAKEIVQGFQTEARQTIWQRILNYIRQRFEPTYLTAIQRLNNEIQEAIETQNIDNYQLDYTDPENYFYSAVSTKHQALKKTITDTRRAVETLIKSGKATAEKFHLERLSDDAILLMDTEVKLVDSINTIVGIADRQIQEIQRLFKNASKTDNKMNEAILFKAQHVDDQIIPFMRDFQDALEAIRAETSVADTHFISTLNSLISSIEAVKQANDKLQPDIKKADREHQLKVFNKIWDQTNIPEDQRAEYWRQYNEGGQDISLFGKFLGIISDSTNPALKMLHAIVSNINTNARNKFMRRSREFINWVKSNDALKYQADIIDGDTGYYLQPTDEPGYYKAYEEFQANKLQELTGEPLEEIKKKLKGGKRVAEILTDDNMYLEYTSALDEFRAEWSERPMTESYYAERKKQLQDLEIRPSTQTFLRALQERRAEIVNPYRVEGVIDGSKLTNEDKVALAQVSKDKVAAKSPLTPTGQLRPGLRLVRPDKITQAQLGKLPLTAKQKENILLYDSEMVVLEDGYTKEMLDEETRRAFDINMLDYAYFLEKDGQIGLSPSNKLKAKIKEFSDRIKQTTDPVAKQAIVEEYKDFVENNITLHLTDELFERMGQRTKFKDAAENYAESLKDPDARASFERQYEAYKELATEYKWTLKQNKKPHTIFQTDIENLQNPTRLRLLEIEDQMYQLRMEMAIPSVYFETDKDPDYTTVISEDFERLAADNKMSPKEYAKQHMTVDNLSKVNRFEREVKAVILGNSTQFESRTAEFLAELRKRPGFVYKTDPNELVEQLTTEYAKSRMATYMKQTLPTQVTLAVQNIYTNPDNLLKAINRKEEAERAGYPDAPEWIKVIPDYTWSSEIDNDTYRNKDYKQQKHRLQLKTENPRFFEKFGINPEEWRKLKTDDISQLTPTKNKEQFKLLVEVTRIREEALELQGESETVSKYLRAQKYKDKIEKLTTYSTLESLPSTIKDELQEFTQSREDDQDYGDRVSTVMGGKGVTVRQIPKYFTRKLEDPKMLTKDVISAELMFLQAAIQYSERKEALPDVVSIQRRIADNNYKPQFTSSKSKKITEGSVSNVAAKGNEYVNYNIYGVKQSRQMVVNVLNKEVDMTKVISKVQNYSSFLNLAYNLFVDVTGATTALLNNTVDRLVGDYYTSESKSWANKKATSWMPNYIKNYKSLSQDDPMSIMLESMGVIDPMKRLENSRNSRVVRLLEASAYFMSEMSNLSFVPSIALAVTKEDRYYKGQFLTFDQYRAARLVEDAKLSQKQLKSEFKMLFNDSLFDHFDIKPEGLQPNEKFRERFPENTEEMFDQQLAKASRKIKSIAMQVDGVLNNEEKLSVQRDVLTNTLIQHRGWFPIILSRRFKKGSYSIAKDKFEEGHYRTLFRTTFGIMGIDFKKDGGVSFEPPLQFKKHWDQLSVDEKRNMHRAAIETAVLLLLLMIGSGIDFRDDDDDDAELFSKLIYLRTVSEFNTQSLTGVFKTGTEIYRSPVPSLKLFEMVNPFTWDETFAATTKETSGEKRMKALRKYTPLKRLDQYSDLQSTIDMYRYYNAPTLTYFNMSLASKDRPKTNKSKTDSTSTIKIR
jgi:hypothetical protein